MSATRQEAKLGDQTADRTLEYGWRGSTEDPPPPPRANVAPGDGMTADLNARLIRQSPDDHNPNHSGRKRAGTRQWT